MESTALTILISSIPTTITFQNSELTILALPPLTPPVPAFSLSAKYTYDTLPDIAKRLFDSVEEMFRCIAKAKPHMLSLLNEEFRMTIDFGVKKEVILPLEKRKDSQQEKDLRYIIGELVDKTGKLEKEMKEMAGKTKHCQVSPYPFQPIVKKKEKENMLPALQLQPQWQRQSQSKLELQPLYPSKKSTKIIQLSDKVDSLQKRNTKLLIQNQRLAKQLKEKKQQVESWKNKYEIALGSLPKQPALKPNSEQMTLTHIILPREQLRKSIKTKLGIVNLCFYNTDIGDEGAQFLLKQVNWNSLKEVRLIGNKIRNIRWNPMNLQSLELLDLQSNQLQTLPTTIKLLASLKFINLNKNRMLMVPVEIFSLAKMEMLVIGSIHQLMRTNYQYWRAVKEFVVRF